MKLTKKLLPVAGAAAMIATSMVTPTVAQAETSASMAFSNMYLWRGQNLSPDGSVISGSLDYSNESGMYAGVWTTSEDDGHETDLYIGYGGEASGISYDVSYWWYLYPEERTGTDGTGLQQDLGDTDAAEIVLSLGYMDFSFAYYMQVDSDNDDDNYITLGYSFGDFGITYGFWDFENSGGDEYSHLTLTYSPIDELSFAISKASSDLNDDSGVEEDPLFQVTYSKDFDLK